MLVAAANATNATSTPNATNATSAIDAASVASPDGSGRRRLSLSSDAVRAAVLQELQHIADFDAEAVSVDGPLPADEGEEGEVLGLNGGHIFDVNVAVPGFNRTSIAEQVVASVESATFLSALASHLGDSFEVLVLSTTMTLLGDSPPAPPSRPVAQAGKRGRADQTRVGLPSEDAVIVPLIIGVPMGLGAIICVCASCLYICFCQRTPNAELARAGTMLGGPSTGQAVAAAPPLNMSDGLSLLERVKQQAAAEKAQVQAEAAARGEPNPFPVVSLIERVKAQAAEEAKAAEAAKEASGSPTKTSPNTVLQDPAAPAKPSLSVMVPPSTPSPSAGNVKLGALQNILRAGAAQGAAAAAPSEQGALAAPQEQGIPAPQEQGLSGLAVLAAMNQIALTNPPEAPPSSSGRRRRSQSSRNGSVHSSRAASEQGAPVAPVLEAGLSWLDDEALANAERQRHHRSRSSHAGAEGSRHNGQSRRSPQGGHRPSSRNANGSRHGSRTGSHCSESGLENSMMFV